MKTDKVAPQYFYDPVTLDIMSDPVVCSDGRTYDRQTAVRLKTSPFTRDTLQVLVDNIDVRGAIFECFPNLAEQYRREKAANPTPLAPPHSQTYQPGSSARVPTSPREGYGIQTFADGRYEGLFHHGALHGLGRAEWRNGTKYIGNFENGKITGEGRIDYATGSSYEGTFFDGSPMGQGRADYADGMHYEGGFNDGEHHGWGVMEFDGYRYEGEFNKGQRHGWGIKYCIKKGQTTLSDQYANNGYNSLRPQRQTKPICR